MPPEGTISGWSGGNIHGWSVASSTGHRRWVVATTADGCAEYPDGGDPGAYMGRVSCGWCLIRRVAVLQALLRLGAVEYVLRYGVVVALVSLVQPLSEGHVQVHENTPFPGKAPVLLVGSSYLTILTDCHLIRPRIHDMFIRPDQAAPRSVNLSSDGRCRNVL